MSSSCIGARGSAQTTLLVICTTKNPFNFAKTGLGQMREMTVSGLVALGFCCGGIDRRHEEHRWDTGWLQRAVTYLFAEPLPDDL